MSGLLTTSALALTLVLGAGDRAGSDKREQAALVFYGAAKYQEAVDLYAQLFADYGKAEYLYNVGRCYQSMGNAERALNSFREYLRKATKISPATRNELEAHIKEMEALQASRDSLGNKLNGVGAEAQVARTNQGQWGTSMDAIADAYLARLRANPEKAWREQAITVDEGKLARNERMVHDANANDPRFGEYLLYLGTQYAGKHFTLRLQELESARADGKTVVGERPLGRAINSSFVAATDYLATTAKLKGFAEADQALARLAVLLQANNMEARARTVVLQLLRTYPDSKYSAAVQSSAGP